MKKETARYPLPKHSAPAVLKEVAVAPGIGQVISVRSAKAHLSALLELVASGLEITITSDGKPKAKLVNATSSKPRRVFEGMGDYLRKQPLHGGPSAEQLVREDRDGRGW